MYQHFILIASSYTKGTRVGLHLVAQGQIDPSIIEATMKRISSINRTDLGVHSFMLDRADWESVIAFDSFFKDVQVYSDLTEFEEVLLLDKHVTAIDIAKFFLSAQPMSHLKLQKIVYLAYKEYLIQYKKKLFAEKIVAYQYGPVVEEVYHMFKKHGATTIDIEDSKQYRLECADDDEKYMIKDIRLYQATARMKLAEDSDKILPVLMEVLEKFGDWSAGELVTFTHKSDSPWSTVYQEDMNCEITDDIILAQAKHEVA